MTVNWPQLREHRVEAGLLGFGLSSAAAAVAVGWPAAAAGMVTAVSGAIVLVVKYQQQADTVRRKNDAGEQTDRLRIREDAKTTRLLIQQHAVLVAAGKAPDWRLVTARDGMAVDASGFARQTPTPACVDTAIRPTSPPGQQSSAPTPPDRLTDGRPKLIDDP